MIGPARDLLIIKLGDLRGFVQSLPAMKAIRAAHRTARITLLTAQPAQTLAVDAPYFDMVEGVYSEDDLRPAIQVCKRAKYDLVFDLEMSPASERIFQALRPFPPPWCGAAKGAKFRFDPVEQDPVPHAIDARLALVALAGVKPVGEPFPDSTWAVTARRGAPSLQPAFFNLKPPFVLLCPTRKVEGGPQRWSAARFAGLAKRLLTHGVDVAVASVHEDREIARLTIENCPEARDLISRADITQVAALAARSAGAFGHGDSGVLHLVAATGARTIALMPVHPSLAAADAPRGRGVVALASPDLESLTVEYVASTFAMFANIAELKSDDFRR